MWSINQEKDIEIPRANMPSYFRLTNITNAIMNNTFAIFGKVKGRAVEESLVSGRICKILSPNTVMNKATVIRDDGTVWTIYLDNFESWKLIKVVE